MPFKALRHPVRALFYAYFLIIGARPASGKVQIIGRHAPPYLTWKIFRILGLRETSSPAPLAFQNIDATITTASPAINGDCVDISKSTVAKVFEEVFGYSLAVDPHTFAGDIVEKSDENAAHDGRIIAGPLKAFAAGVTHQRLIDNTIGQGLVEDLRTCVVGEEIPFVYRKRRPVAVRFKNVTPSISSCHSSEVFTPQEEAQIIAFAQAIGLDVGEMDILRDNATGRIYIVDVNKTPNSPGAAYFGPGAIVCMHRAAAAFRRQFLDRDAKRKSEAGNAVPL